MTDPVALAKTLIQGCVNGSFCALNGHKICTVAQAVLDLDARIKELEHQIASNLRRVADSRD